MNQALQVNFTCGNNVLGMIADVNFNDNYINVSSDCVFVAMLQGMQTQNTAATAPT